MVLRGGKKVCSPSPSPHTHIPIPLHHHNCHYFPMTSILLFPRVFLIKFFSSFKTKTCSPVKFALERKPVCSTSTTGFRCFLDRLQLFPYFSCHTCILPNLLHISNYHLWGTCRDPHILDRSYLKIKSKAVQKLKMCP